MCSKLGGHITGRRHVWYNRYSTLSLRNVYIDTAREVGFQPGPEHFGYTIRAFCADTDEQAIEIGRTFMWTQDHRAPGPREHNDPPGYQSREAVRLQRARPQGAFGQRLSYAQLQDIDFYVLGNPATVTRKLRQLIERLNPGYLLIYGNEGDMAHKDVMRSIELLGKEVIPALHAIKLHPYE